MNDANIFSIIISDNSRFNVLQLNAKGIANKLTELGVVLEINKIKVAVIQESKLSSKSKHTCIRNEEPVPAEILDVMTRRDDLRRRDPPCWDCQD